MRSLGCAVATDKWEVPVSIMMYYYPLWYRREYEKKLDWLSGRIPSEWTLNQTYHIAGMFPAGWLTFWQVTSSRSSSNTMYSFPNIKLSYYTRTYVNNESYLRRLHECIAYQADCNCNVFYPPCFDAWLEQPIPKIFFPTEKCIPFLPAYLRTNAQHSKFKSMTS